MAIQMTRAQYEATYGAKPVVSSSSLDITPTPVRMTRAEYEEKFFPKKQTFLQEANQDRLEMGQDIDQSLQQGTQARQRIRERVEQGEVSPAKGTFQTLGTGLRTGFNVLGNIAMGAAKAVLPQSVETRIKETLGADLAKITDPEKRKAFVDRLASSEFAIDRKAAEGLRQVGEAYRTDETFRTDVQAALGAAEAATSLLSGPLVRQTANAVSDVAKGAVNTAKKAAKSIELPDQATRALEKDVKTLTDLENQYAQLRKLNQFSKDAEASRSRVIKSGVLNEAVDADGTIITKGPNGAVEQYRKLTIDGIEDVVKRNLEREGKTVSIPEIKATLLSEIYDSGLEGADLARAVKGIESELKGLRLRADDLDQLGLEKLQDFKISATKQINYNTPPETATYRKAIARGYKTLIEKKSTFNVKEVNTELQKYYQDIERLEALDGKKVKGGRLGKYFAQVSGNIIGATAGSVGGAPGAAIGTILGGEAAGLIKGAQMSRTFKAATNTLPDNAILKAAREKAGLPSVRDLETPDAPVGIPQSVLSKLDELGTPDQKKEVAGIEAKIKKNVADQKAAIAAKDYTLVAALKEVYVALVDRLKAVVAEIIESAKNPTIGLSIKASVTPQKVAKAIDFEDWQNIMEILEDPQAALLNDKLTNFMEKIGIWKADLDTQVEFLRKVTDEAEQAGVLQSNNLGKRNTQYQATNNKSNTVIEDTVPANGEGVNAGGVDSATPSTNLLENSDDYLYHGTSKGALETIRTQGIVPQRRGVSSFSTDEAYSRTFADQPEINVKGEMLRVRKDVMVGETTKPKGTRPQTDEQFEILTKETIPPEALEIFKDGKWQPLVESKSNLLEEAKKYKSAGDFFKSKMINGSPLYHGSDKEIIKFKLPQEQGLYGKGVYFYADEAEAKNFVSMLDNSEITRAFPVNKNFATNKQFDDAILKAKKTGLSPSKAKDAATKQLSSEGYIGIEDDGLYVVFNPDDIKSITEMWDIWNASR